MTDQELKAYRLSKLPKRVSFSAFDAFYTCPSRYCVEQLNPEEEESEETVYEAICIKAFPPMGLKKGDKVEYQIIDDTYILEEAGAITDEIFDTHFEDAEDYSGLALPDLYWAALGTALQNLADWACKRHLEILDLESNLSSYILHDANLMAEYLYPNDSDLYYSQQRIKLPQGKIIQNAIAFPVELGSSALKTIQKRFVKTIQNLAEPMLEKLLILDLSKVKTEMYFNYVDQNDITYGGSADMVIFHQPDLATIIDGKFNYNPRKHSKDQLFFYSWLLSKIGVDIKDLAFWDYKENKIHKIKYNQYDVNRVGKKASKFLEDLKEAIEEDDFPESVNGNCKYCLKRDMCEEYKSEY